MYLEFLNNKPYISNIGKKLKLQINIVVIMRTFSLRLRIGQPCHTKQQCYLNQNNL